MSSKLNTRKSVHINLTVGTHTAFRIAMLQRGLSMQEVFEELAVLISENDPYLNSVLAGIAERKTLGKTRKIPNADAESIFKIIEENNPLDSEA